MSIQLDAPSVVLFSGADTTRNACLLVAGSYPAKNLVVTTADLDALVAHFSDPVPVQVEHISSPLDPLGQVVKLWRTGDALMGTVQMSAEAAAIIAKRGAHKLSVGMLQAPAWQLQEVSLTNNPHVPQATLLSDSEHSELVQLRASRVETQITALKAAGRLVPASEALARALLAAPDLVTLSDGGQVSTAETFRRFLEAQPAVVPLGELARAKGPTTLSGGASGAAASTEMPEFSEADHEVMRRLGVAPADVAATMAADKKGKM